MMGRAALGTLLALACSLLAAPAAPGFDGRFRGDANEAGARISFTYRGGEVAGLRGARVPLHCRRRSDRRMRVPRLGPLAVDASGHFEGERSGKRRDYSFLARARGRVDASRGRALGRAGWSLRYGKGDTCHTRPGGVRWQARNEDLYFASRFEPDVAVGAPKAQLGSWRTTISGADHGFSWTTDLPGDRRPDFLTLLPAEQNPSDFYAVELHPGQGIGGSSALYQAVIRDGDSPTGRVRNQFATGWPGRRGYVSYMLRLQPDALWRFPLLTSSWRRIMEWGEAGPDPAFRIAVELRGSASSLLPRWYAAGLELSRRADGTTATRPVWQHFSNQPFPSSGSWMHVEAQWYEHPRDGRFQFWIDGRQIVDYRGRTRGEIPLTPQIFKVYASQNVLRQGPAYQWIDDVVLAKRRLGGGF